MNTRKHEREGLNESYFIQKLFISVKDIYARHLQAIVDKKIEGDFNTYGTPKEQCLKSIVTQTGYLSNNLEDIDKVLTFLKIDKSKIAKIYGDSIDTEDYFKYHYDNFIIRLATTLDICGKIGITVYDLKTKRKLPNWHDFAYHPTMKNTAPSNKIIEFSTFLEKVRNQRHAKVHTGENKENSFDNVIFWEPFQELMDKNEPRIYDNILEDYNKIQIQVEIDIIETQIASSVNYILNFLDSMTERLDQIIKEEE